VRLGFEKTPTLIDGVNLSIRQGSDWVPHWISSRSAWPSNYLLHLQQFCRTGLVRDEDDQEESQSIIAKEMIPSFESFETS
jgi:hypothetical protein